ncbi:MAG: hypothetical protein AAGF73_14510 [Actinomycetota bacterium]
MTRLPNRTATSLLQVAMFGAEGELADRGVFLAETGRRGNCHHDHLRGLRAGLSNADVQPRCASPSARSAAAILDNIDLLPGLQMSMVEDPDGHWVEFIDPAD